MRASFTERNAFGGKNPPSHVVPRSDLVQPDFATDTDRRNEVAIVAHDNHRAPPTRKRQNQIRRTPPNRNSN
ncbi:hypothetical protein RBSH_00373 [Rhodopirellula baltica SH28]|uniref:Uncharacterized protein n=1 Tax=Rhodopirellula baltica SH28 TaxID=993517 RepID=K5EEP1_RHOBT|nr:hypothetical protein RBSH_00373 [Rhodopirellula baltica SH28]